MVPPHHMPAGRADINPVWQLEFLMDMPTGAAGLTGWEELPHFDDDAPIPFRFIREHPDEHPPSVVTGRLPKGQRFLDGGHRKVLNTDDVIVSYKPV